MRHAETARHVPARMFASSRGRRRFGRATDVFLLVPSLLGLAPVPGGIGVTELGLTVGPTAAGTQEAAALAAVVLYPLATFYLPPARGFVAMRWLQRNAHL